MARPKSNARAELLASVIAWVADNGIGDVSLRTLAEAIGTSHRMLLFHFGSKDQLMVEVVRAVEADQRATVVEIAAGDGVDITDRMRQHWLSLLDPALRNNIRLFYEVYADALRGRTYTKDFLDEVMNAWLPPVTAAFESTSGVANAPIDARLVLAVTRGLLLDLVTTGDVEGVDAAMQRFATMFSGVVAPHG
jgi:AcrR family transcriptional regulator